MRFVLCLLIYLSSTNAIASIDLGRFEGNFDVNYLHGNAPGFQSMTLFRIADYVSPRDGKTYEALFFGSFRRGYNCWDSKTQTYEFDWGKGPCEFRAPAFDHPLAAILKDSEGRFFYSNDLGSRGSFDITPAKLHGNQLVVRLNGSAPDYRTTKRIFLFESPDRIELTVIGRDCVTPIGGPMFSFECNWHFPWRSVVFNYELRRAH